MYQVGLGLVAVSCKRPGQSHDAVCVEVGHVEVRQVAVAGIEAAGRGTTKVNYVKLLQQVDCTYFINDPTLLRPTGSSTKYLFIRIGR
jgi:hypothetical protein